MAIKTPFKINDKILAEAAASFETPFYIYDVDGMLDSANELCSAFSWAPNFKNFFAVKALPRGDILAKLKNSNSGVECCSLSELELASQLGYSGNNVLYTCIYPNPKEVIKARELKAMVNLDYAENINILFQNYIPKVLLFRLNPGNKIKGEKLLGEPSQSKFGSTEQQIKTGFQVAMEAGVNKLGIHGMFASNTLDINYLQKAYNLLFESAINMSYFNKVPVHIIDLGGGIGIPYRSESSVNITHLGNLMKSSYQDKFYCKSTAPPPRIVMECGRFICGPHGYLVTRVLNVKKTYKDFVFVDACATNYPRPGVYGGYNKISVLNKSDEPSVSSYDIVGLMCDNCDQFAVDRLLPKVFKDDILIIHDAGAHAAAMSYDYNGRLRCKEIILENGTLRLMRRAQTITEYLNA